MENHPIPQDVTGFKFKLIGSVTVKQFLYIMAGGILAAVTFMLPMSIVIRIPLCLLFGGIGAALAFVPIEGRPMDVMLKNFFKALPSENQYIFKKRGADALIAEFLSAKPTVEVKAERAKTQEENSLETRRSLLFKTLRTSYKPDDREQAVLLNINSYLNESAHPISMPVQNIDNIPKESSPTQIVALPTPTAVVLQPSQPTQIVQPVTNTQSVVVAPPAPSQTVEKIAEQKAEEQAPEPQRVPTINPDTNLTAGFPSLPDTPNVVMGIVKDPRGRVLPNILVEIMDEKSTPVRAFKTNALGQFAAATPLSNGEYNVLLEDPKKENEFEQIHISLNGEIFNPLVIVTVDQREKLRRELFGATPALQAVI